MQLEAAGAAEAATGGSATGGQPQAAQRSNSSAMPEVMQLQPNLGLPQCEICREDKEPIPFGSVVEKINFKHHCCLCHYEVDVCVCRNCMFPWLEEYEGRMQNAEEAMKYVPKDEREIACALCILEEQSELQIKDLMSIEQMERLILVEKALDKHGDPPIIATSTEICSPKVANPSCASKQGGTSASSSRNDPPSSSIREEDCRPFGFLGLTSTSHFP